MQANARQELGEWSHCTEEAEPSGEGLEQRRPDRLPPEISDDKERERNPAPSLRMVISAVLIGACLWGALLALLIL